MFVYRIEELIQSKPSVHPFMGFFLSLLWHVLPLWINYG